MNQFKKIILVAVSCSLSLACDDDASDGSGASVEAKQEPASAKSPAVEAQELFQATCSSCHGPEGQGNGPASAALDPKPRDFADAAWQSSLTDEEVSKVIVAGGMGVGKSPLMPAQPQLKSKPEVLEELVKLIRSFAKPE